MNVIAVILKVLSIANAMIGKPPLPNLRLRPKLDTGRMRISSFDELHCALQGDVDGGRKHQMNVFGHNNKSMQLESSLPFVAIKGFQEKPGIGLDHEKVSALPSREVNEISAGRGDCASRFHSKPQRLEAAHIQPSTARLKAVPFPFKIGQDPFGFGKQ
jgi:hypothetical protein